MAFAMAQRRAGPPRQKLAQVAAPHLCDAPEPRFAAGRVLARCQAEEGGELTPAGEGAGVLDGGHDRRGGDWANAGNGHQPLGRLVRLDRRRKLPVDRSDGLIERVDLADKRTKRAAHAIGDHDLAILVETVGSHALQAIGMLRALRRDEADLGQMAAQSVERRRALAGEQLARPMAHQLGLVVDRTHRHEPLARPTHLGPYYSDVGRPSIDPELMIRMLIVGYCFGIRSERRLCEEVHLNLAYRWFL